MSNTFARKLAFTLMHAGFLLSSIFNVMAVSPTTACSGAAIAGWPGLQTCRGSIR